MIRELHWSFVEEKKMGEFAKTNVEVVLTQNMLYIRKSQFYLKMLYNLFCIHHPTIFKSSIHLLVTR